MSILHYFDINNPLNALGLWKEFGSSFHNIAQAICEFVDNGISNLRCHSEDETLVRKVCIWLRKEAASVIISVEDGGTGILDLNNAMTIAGVDAQETPMNEHGFGLKHSLAYMDGGSCTWSISTRTRDDADADCYREVKSPYNFGIGSMQGRIHSGWIGQLGATGTLIRAVCSPDVFQTLNTKNAAKVASFEELVAALREELRYTYATILLNREVEIELVTQEGTNVKRELLTPLLPQWDGSTLVELPVSTFNLGGGNLEIFCRYGSIRGNENNFSHYVGDMDSSGVEIRINGRAIAHEHMRRIWGRKIHPSQNAFLAQIDLRTDCLDTLPPTKTAKNGFREENEKLRELYRWIKSTVKIPDELNQTREEKLFEKFVKKLEAEGKYSCIEREKPVFCTLGINDPLDLFTCRNGEVTIYEGKAGNTKTDDVFQLMRYWHGCIEDGTPAEAGVLIAGQHPENVLKMLKYINRLSGPDGRRYNFRVETWTEHGVTL